MYYTDIHAVSPSKGSTEGGTLITVTGTGFGLDPADVEVDIDGTQCTVTSSSPTEIQCVTGRPPQGSPAIATAQDTYPAVDDGYRFKGMCNLIFLNSNQKLIII